MNALVAQLDRAPDFGSGGLRFKSLQAHQNKVNIELITELK